MSVAGAIRGAKILGGIGSKVAKFIPGVGPAAGIISAGAGLVGGALQKDKIKAGLLDALKGETGPSKEATDVAEAASRANIGNQALSANILAQGPQAGRSGGRSFAPQGQAAAENRARVQDTIKEAAAATGVQTGKAMIAAGERQLDIKRALFANEQAKKEETKDALYGEVNPKTGVRGVGFVKQLGGVLDEVGDEVAAGNNPFTGQMKKVAEEVTGGGAPAEAAAAATYDVVRGDTLGEIATQHGTTIEALQAANPDLIRNPNLIKEGWQLKIPGAAAGAPTGSAQAVADDRSPEGEGKIEDQVAIDTFAGEGEEDGERMIVNDIGETREEQEAGAAYGQERRELADSLDQMNKDFGPLTPKARETLKKLINPTVWKEYSEENKQAIMRLIPMLFETHGTIPIRDPFEGEL